LCDRSPYTPRQRRVDRDRPIDGFDISTITLPDDSRIAAIHIIHLALNLGHQRVIATGLTLSTRKDLDGAIVMDSDGEDQPDETPLLLAATRATPDQVVLAHRARRSQSARSSELATARINSCFVY
jgi:hypothetical protein